MKGLDWLANHIEELGFKVSEIERRERNRRRKGKIAEISDDKSKYRVELSQQDGKPYLTPWIKARTLAAGGVKIDVLYSVGEQVDVVSESGELSDAQIDFSTYSDDNARENGDTPGKSRLTAAACVHSFDTRCSIFRRFRPPKDFTPD